jgi:hypothetical protein
VPPSRSAQETLDWIKFTTEFVNASAKVEIINLDRATRKEITFMEALGLTWGNLPLKEVRRLEKTWASDDGQYLDFTTVQTFMDMHSNASADMWDRIIWVRDAWHTELAALNV